MTQTVKRSSYEQLRRLSLLLEGQLQIDDAKAIVYGIAEILQAIAADSVIENDSPKGIAQIAIVDDIVQCPLDVSQEMLKFNGF